MTERRRGERGEGRRGYMTEERRGEGSGEAMTEERCKRRTGGRRGEDRTLEEETQAQAPTGGEGNLSWVWEDWDVDESRGEEMTQDAPAEETREKREVRREE